MQYLTCIFSVYTRTHESLASNTSGKWDIPCNAKRERCITILYRVVENTAANTVARDGKVECTRVEYTTVFLYSDWLYFL